MTSDTVQISFTLAVSEPGTISISNPGPAESLKLVATVKQESSPFPDRAVTLLTTNSIFDTGEPDAFFRKLMASPTDVSDDKVKICMYRFGYWITIYPLRGVRDMHRRDNHGFMTIPPPGKGSIKVTWSLAPERLLHFYKEEGSLEERLKKFTAGQRFKIDVGRTMAVWWTWGSLQHDLKDKKFSRWSLPNDLPLVREAGQDEDSEVNRCLIDIVDRTDVVSIINRWNLPGTPDPDDEEPPNVKWMRMQGWVFGEPSRALKLTCTQAATFEFVE